MWLVAILASASCSSASGGLTLETGEGTQGGVEQRIDGVWRLTSYVPEQALSPALLLSLQGEKLMVRFDAGRLRSETEGMAMDRAYRIADASANRFKLFVKDDTGVEYESMCELDDKGRLLFNTVTSPWRGRGMLEREGGAMAAAVEQ